MLEARCGEASGAVFGCSLNAACGRNLLYAPSLFISVVAVTSSFDIGACNAEFALLWGFTAGGALVGVSPREYGLRGGGGGLSVSLVSARLLIEGNLVFADDWGTLVILALGSSS